MIAHDGVYFEEFSNLNFKTKLNRSLNILYTRSFLKWQGVDLLVKAAAKICKDFDLKLIEGNQSDIKRLNKFIIEKKINNVELILKIDWKNLLNRLKEADVLLLPNTDDNINRWDRLL